MIESSYLRPGVRWLLILLLLAGPSASPVYAQSPVDASFTARLGQLRDATFADKANIVEQLGRSGHPSARAVLTALLESRLYFRNQDQKVFIAKTAEQEDSTSLKLIDPLTLEDAGSASPDSLTKIITNNHLRRVLQTTLARFALSNADASVRLEAVREIEHNLDAGNVQLLRERGAAEADSQVKREIAIALALAGLDSSDAQVQLSAISTLHDSLRPDVRNKLEALLQKSPDGSFVESDEHVRQAAAAAVKSINRWRTGYSGIQTLFFGFSLGCVLVLVAIGLAITFGVMGVINMAHGELMMLGAYTTYVVQLAMPGHTGLSILLAVPAAFLVAGLTGIFIERTVIRFLYGRWRRCSPPSESA
jgi:urea transport system permease protein